MGVGNGQAPPLNRTCKNPIALGSKLRCLPPALEYRQALGILEDPLQQSYPRREYVQSGTEPRGRSKQNLRNCTGVVTQERTSTGATKSADTWAATPVDSIDTPPYTDRHGSPFHSPAGSAAIPTRQPRRYLYRAPDKRSCWPSPLPARPFP